VSHSRGHWSCCQKIKAPEVHSEAEYLGMPQDFAAVPGHPSALVLATSSNLPETPASTEAMLFAMLVANLCSLSGVEAERQPEQFQYEMECMDAVALMECYLVSANGTLTPQRLTMAE